MTVHNARHARRCVGEVGQRQPRAARPQPGHHRLRQHRQPAVGARRGVGHAGLLLRHRRQARARQRRCAAPRSTSCSERSDVVTLHVDGRPGNSGLFGEELFGRMRPGQPVPQPLPRVRRRPVGAAPAHRQRPHRRRRASTCSRTSRPAPATRSSSELRGLKNVILTPHIAGSTEEAQQDIGAFVAGKLIAYMDAGTTALSVNMPSVQMPRQPGSSRLAGAAPQPARRPGPHRRPAGRARAQHRAAGAVDHRRRRLRGHRRARRRHARRRRASSGRCRRRSAPRPCCPDAAGPAGSPAYPRAVSDAADLPLIGAAALRARAAARVLRTLPTDAKDAALAAMADALVERTDEVLAANAADVEAAAAAGTPGVGARPAAAGRRPRRRGRGRPARARRAARPGRRRRPRLAGCPTGCSCARCACRSAWSASSTRPART